MQCNCGGETVERKVQRKHKIVCLYDACTACGRIAIFWETDDWREKDEPVPDIPTALSTYW